MGAFGTHMSAKYFLRPGELDIAQGFWAYSKDIHNLFFNCVIGLIPGHGLGQTVLVETVEERDPRPEHILPVFHYRPTIKW